MPTYEYKCKSCGNKWDLFQSMTAKHIRKCPACGKNTAERQFGTGAAIIFKGSGFYETDYRSEDYKKAAEADSKAAKGDTAADTKIDSKTDSKADSKTDTKPDTKSDSKSDSKPETKAETKTESKAKQADSKAPAKTDGKPDAKPTAKASDSTPAAKRTRSGRG
jgi:putative FmdB family regulatory protein